MVTGKARTLCGRARGCWRCGLERRCSGAGTVLPSGRLGEAAETRFGGALTSNGDGMRSTQLASTEQAARRRLWATRTGGRACDGEDAGRGAGEGRARGQGRTVWREAERTTDGAREQDGVRERGTRNRQEHLAVALAWAWQQTQGRRKGARRRPNQAQRGGFPRQEPPAAVQTHSGLESLSAGLSVSIAVASLSMPAAAHKLAPRQP